MKRERYIHICMRRETEKHTYSHLYMYAQVYEALSNSCEHHSSRNLLNRTILLLLLHSQNSHPDFRMSLHPYQLFVYEVSSAVVTYVEQFDKMPYYHYYCCQKYEFSESLL